MVPEMNTKECLMQIIIENTIFKKYTDPVTNSSHVNIKGKMPVFHIII